MSDIGQQITEGLTELADKLEHGEPVPVTTLMLCDECENGYADDAGEYLCPICQGAQVIEIREGDEHGN